MWGILGPTVTEQRTMPWCAGLPPLEHNAAPHQMDDEVPCSMTTMSYHPGTRENRHHLKQKVAIFLLDIMMPVQHIYLKHIVTWINSYLCQFMLYICHIYRNLSSYSEITCKILKRRVKFLLWRNFQYDKLQHSARNKASHIACKCLSNKSDASPM
jgi:hypothetical protein